MNPARCRDCSAVPTISYVACGDPLTTIVSLCGTCAASSREPTSLQGISSDRTIQLPFSRTKTSSEEGSEPAAGQPTTKAAPKEPVKNARESRDIAAPNGEVEGPRRSARLEPRAHTAFPRPRRHYRLSRPPPTIVRSPAHGITPVDSRGAAHLSSNRCPRGKRPSQ